MAKEDIVKYQFDNRTPKEQQEIATSGGIASGIARRRASICRKFLNKMISNEEFKEEMIKNGFDEDTTELAYSMYDLVRTSRDKNEKTNDRLKALEMFMGYADNEVQEQTEAPIVNINIIDNNTLEKAMYDETN